MEESQPTKEHKEKAPISVNAAIMTMSNTRTLEDDDSGMLIKRLLESNGHKIIGHIVIPDDEEKIKENIENFINDKNVDVIIANGGTGLAPKDVTIETIKPLFEKEITGFNALFMKLGYDDVGAASMLSRATAGIVKKTAIFCLPGNPKAVKLGVEKLIIPEMGHIVKHMGE